MMKVLIFLSLFALFGCSEAKKDKAEASNGEANLDKTLMEVSEPGKLEDKGYKITQEGVQGGEWQSHYKVAVSDHGKYFKNDTYVLIRVVINTRSNVKVSGGFLKGFETFKENLKLDSGGSFRVVPTETFFIFKPSKAAMARFKPIPLKFTNTKGEMITVHIDPPAAKKVSILGNIELKFKK